MFFTNKLSIFIILFIFGYGSPYSKVAKLGGSSDSSSSAEIEDDSSPKLYKALNMDLIFPKTFNTTESSMQSNSTRLESTGRASMSSSPFYFPKISTNSRRPYTQYYPGQRPSYPVYRPQAPSQAEIDKLRGKGQAMDRYTPGEAVATALFKQKGNGYQYKPPVKKLPVPTVPPAPPVVTPYVPPKNLYAFPPNLDSNYPPPSPSSSSDKDQATITSYLPPPAGLTDGFNGFFGPVNPDYLPSHLKNPGSSDDSDSKMTAMSSDMDSMNDNSPPSSPPLPPPSPPAASAMDDTSLPDHDHPDNSPSAEGGDDGHDDMMAPPMPPMSMPMDDMHDDDHHHHHEEDYRSHHGPWDSSPSFHGSHGIDAYPELIYDHDHFHSDHPHPNPPVVMMSSTTVEPPPEPRVKKYSYFYIGRKLWYIPLYFTVWFSFYILFLILKSIARHKVNLPNHYQRSLMKRSLGRNDFTEKDFMRQVDRLTESVMVNIEKFKEKFL